jgi:hypothetical protein
MTNECLDILRGDVLIAFEGPDENDNAGSSDRSRSGCWFSDIVSKLKTSNADFVLQSHNGSENLCLTEKELLVSVPGKKLIMLLRSWIMAIIEAATKPISGSQSCNHSSKL